jgi:hypothetical protein
MGVPAPVNGAGTLVKGGLLCSGEPDLYYGTLVTNTSDICPHPCLLQASCDKLEAQLQHSQEELSQAVAAKSHAMLEREQYQALVTPQLEELQELRKAHMQVKRLLDCFM